MRPLTMLIVAAMLGVSANAVAQTETAKELFEKGTAAYALGKYDEAAADYEKAFSLRADPALLYNAAQAHRQAGNKKRALLLYQNYVRLYGSRVSNRAEVDRIIVSLRKAIESDQQAAAAPPTETAPAAPAPNEPTQTAPPPATTRPRATTTSETSTAQRTDLTEQPAEKPLIKKPWFWAVVGGA